MTLLRRTDSVDLANVYPRLKMPLSSTKPILNYLDIGSLGRGEDPYQSRVSIFFNTGKVPALEYKGKTLRQVKFLS
jgi:hypothetical protein